MVVEYTILNMLDRTSILRTLFQTLLLGCFFLLTTVARPFTGNSYQDELAPDQNSVNNPENLKNEIEDLTLRLDEAIGQGSLIDAIRICNNIGLKYFAANNFDKAIDYYLHGLSIADEWMADEETLVPNRELNNLIGHVEKNIADVYFDLLNYDFAIDFYSKAIGRYETTGDETALMLALNELGLSYYYLGQNAIAIEQFIRLLNISERLYDSSMIAGVHNNIGLVQMGNHDFEPAQKSFKLAATLYQKLGDRKREAASLYNIGIIQGELGRYDSILLYHKKVLRLLTEIQFMEGIIKVQIAIAQFYFTKNEIGESEHYLLEALKNAKQAGTKDFIIEIYGYMAQLLAKGGRYREAYSYQQWHQQKRDSMYRMSKEKIAEMRMGYETEKREREKEILKKENKIHKLQLQKQENRFKYLVLLSLLALGVALVVYSRYRLKIRINKQLNEQKQQLEISNVTKDKFFSIIAHDLKNPVFSTRALSEVLYNDFPKLSDSQKETIIANLKKSTELTSQLIENLLQWALSQMGKIDFNPVRTTVIGLIENPVSFAKIDAGKKGIRLIVDVAENIVVMADENMIAVVMRNLLSNAIKFSGPGKEITLKAVSDGDEVRFSIEDQGPGIRSEDLPKLFRTDINPASINSPGPKGTGLGLILCKDFVGRNGGKIWAGSEVGKGSIFTFTLCNGKNQDNHS